MSRALDSTSSQCRAPLSLSLSLSQCRAPVPGIHLSRAPAAGHSPGISRHVALQCIGRPVHRGKPTPDGPDASQSRITRSFRDTTDLCSERPLKTGTFGLVERMIPPVFVDYVWIIRCAGGVPVVATSPRRACCGECAGHKNGHSSAFPLLNRFTCLPFVSLRI